MGRPIKVRPYLPPGRKVYKAYFQNANNTRLHRSLKTKELAVAEKICLALQEWRKLGVGEVKDLPPDPYLPAVPFYFDGVKYKKKDLEAKLSELSKDFKQIAVSTLSFQKGDRSKAFAIYSESKQLKALNDSMRIQLAQMKVDLDEAKAAKANLENTMLAREIEKSQKLPPIAKALELYEKHLSATTTAANVNTQMSVAKKFVLSLPEDLVTLSQVSVNHIEGFLDARSKAGDPNKILARRRNWHIRLARLINWSAKRWEYQSQMSKVEFISRSRLLRERGEIVWHDIDTVEAAIENLPDDYWKALVATLAYAGLRFSELRWLQTKHVELPADGKRNGGSIWVTSETDPEDLDQKHLLKTGNSQRHVNIHAKYLLPRLRKYVNAGYPKDYFFPVHKNVRRRQRIKAGGSPQRWLKDTLSTMLRGHPGGKDQDKRKPTDGLLPSGMNAETLRHTFGSLLIRSHKRSLAEVAAAMGNTEEVVRMYYARILGSEVEVDF